MSLRTPSPLDYFAVKTAKNKWVQVLMIIDIHTRERIDIRVYDGWDVDSWWTIRMFRARMPLSYSDTSTTTAST